MRVVSVGDVMLAEEDTAVGRRCEALDIARAVMFGGIVRGQSIDPSDWSCALLVERTDGEPALVGTLMVLQSSSVRLLPKETM